jgi:cell division septum initiation protein DivIVA
MAISFSRPDPSSPAAVGSAQFSVVRRGFEQEEVRDLLRGVSAELARLQERERFLESELRAMQTRGLSAPGALDEEMVTALLGEETARVLTSAREAAKQQIARAAETAERLVREASSDAARIRQEAEIESSRKRNDAVADVEAEIELAKQQGREMVIEAREYREKVLSELARRRELAREQIEHLIHDRDRLVAAFDRARLAANDVVGDLTEFDELSEEVARISGLSTPVDATAPIFFDYTKEPDAIPQSSESIEVEKVVGVIAESIDSITVEVVEAVEIIETDLVIEVEEVIEVEDAIAVEEVIEEAPDTTVVAMHEAPAGMSEHPSSEPPAQEHIAEVVQLFGKKRKEVEAPQVVNEVVEPPVVVVEPVEAKKEPVASTPQKKSVDDLFARLKQTNTAEVARTTKPKVVVPKVDQGVFDHRDEVLEPIMVLITRKMKRVLADEENSMLTYLQGKKSVVALEKVLPLADEHLQMYVEALSEDVISAAMAGAQSLSKSLKADLRKRVTRSAVMQVVSRTMDESTIRPLREKIQRAVEQSNGDKDEMSNLIRSVYREMKMQRVEQQVSDIARMAYSRGAYLVLDQGTQVCWMVDPNGPSCADAEDNSLAGSTDLGSEFPTGHVHPTAHAGCRCLIAPIGD